MFENNTGTHVTVTKYILVGVFLAVSILALGWGVWSYTYQQNLQEPVATEPVDTSIGVQYSAEERETIRKNAATNATSTEYTPEEREAIRQAATNATSTEYTPEEREAIRNSR